jgi:membrane protein
MGRHHMSIIAAGIAFYGLVVLFPAIAVLISVWGLAFNPEIIEQQIRGLAGALPPSAAAIVKEQVNAVAARAATQLSFAAMLSLLIAFYASSLSVNSLIEGLNIIYGERERRGYLVRMLLAFLLTLALIVTMLATLALIVFLPVALGQIGVGSTAAVISWLRWPLLAGMAVVGLSMIYRVAPSHSRPQSQWVSWGAVIATFLWVLGSIGFSTYVSNFGSYDRIYGSLGAVIVVLTWFWLSAFIILMGAQLNAEIERETASASARNESRQSGLRSAEAVDMLGETN